MSCLGGLCIISSIVTLPPLTPAVAFFWAVSRPSTSYLTLRSSSAVSGWSKTPLYFIWSRLYSILSISGWFCLLIITLVAGFYMAFAFRLSSRSMSDWDGFTAVKLDLFTSSITLSVLSVPGACGSLNASISLYCSSSYFFVGFLYFDYFSFFFIICCFLFCSIFTKSSN